MEILKLEHPFNLYDCDYKYVAIYPYIDHKFALCFNITKDFHSTTYFVMTTVNIDAKEDEIVLNSEDLMDDLDVVVDALKENNIIDKFSRYTSSGYVDDFPVYKLSKEFLKRYSHVLTDEQ